MVGGGEKKLRGTKKWYLCTPRPMILILILSDREKRSVGGDSGIDVNGNSEADHDHYRTLWIVDVARLLYSVIRSKLVTVWKSLCAAGD
jgi:hypothetical protein